MTLEFKRDRERARVEAALNVYAQANSGRNFNDELSGEWLKAVNSKSRGTHHCAARIA